MSSQKISLPFVKLLIRLTEGEEISASEFKGSSLKFLEKFLEDYILDFEKPSPQRKLIRCSDNKKLYDYLLLKHQVRSSLEEYLEIVQEKEYSRAKASQIATDKVVKKRIFKGFLVNSFDKIETLVNGVTISLPSVSGTFTYIEDFNRFSIPENVVVVVVENYTNFLFASRFCQIIWDKPLLFVWRYQNTSSIVEWLKFVPNDYIHFGDFDLKGLHIYLQEFKSKLPEKNSIYFIPDNIDYLFEKYSNRDLYEDQLENLRNYDFTSDKQVKLVYDLIFKYKAGVNQEVLINIDNAF